MQYVSPVRRSTFSPASGNLRRTSGYGPRINPVTGAQQSLHNGIDLGIPTGTPIYSIARGVVSSVDDSCEDPTNGAYISVTHPDGSRSSYVHMSEIFVRRGQEVNENTKLGLSGGDRGNPCSGRSTGPHLHFIIRPDGRNSADPTPLVNWYPYTLTDGNGSPISGARSSPWGSALAQVPVYVWFGLGALSLLTIGVFRRRAARREARWRQIADGRYRAR